MTDDLEPRTMLFDFSRSEEIRRWQPVNDVVMGGCSESRVEETAGGGMAFIGRVSLQRGGGFASIRSGGGDFPTAGTSGVVLTLRGDGRRYKFSVRCDRALDGLTYQAPLVTVAGSRQTIRIPWPTLHPSYHGRLLANRPPLDPGTIQRFGLVIAEGQEGPFRLELYRIEAYREAP